MARGPCPGVSAVVMDPKNGAVLRRGQLSVLRREPVSAGREPNARLFIDPVVASATSPAPSSRCSPPPPPSRPRPTLLTTRINDTGTLKLDTGGLEVADADRTAKGLMTLRRHRCLVPERRRFAGRLPARQSSTRSRRQVLYRHVAGSARARTGIDLAGEVTGIVADPVERRGRRSTSPTVVRTGGRRAAHSAHDRVLRAVNGGYA